MGYVVRDSRTEQKDAQTQLPTCGCKGRLHDPRGGDICPLAVFLPTPSVHISRTWPSRHWHQHSRLGWILVFGVNRLLNLDKCSRVSKVN